MCRCLYRDQGSHDPPGQWFTTVLSAELPHKIILSLSPYDFYTILSYTLVQFKLTSSRHSLLSRSCVSVSVQRYVLEASFFALREVQSGSWIESIIRGKCQFLVSYLSIPSVCMVTPICLAFWAHTIFKYIYMKIKGKLNYIRKEMIKI